MAVNESTGLRTAKLSAGFVPTFPAGSVFDFYSGARPANGDTAPSGTLLASATLPATPWGTPASGSVAKNGTWTATGVAGAGAGTNIGWARLRTSGDAGGASTTLARLDFTVTATGGGGDFTIDNVNIANGQSMTINTLTVSG